MLIPFQPEDIYKLFNTIDLSHTFVCVTTRTTYDPRLILFEVLLWPIPRKRDGWLKKFVPNLRNELQCLDLAHPIVRVIVFGLKLFLTIYIDNIMGFFFLFFVWICIQYGTFIVHNLSLGLLYYSTYYTRYS